MTCRIVTLVLFLTLVGANAEASPAEAAEFGKSYSIHSSTLDEDREYQVFLPDSYDWAKDRNYPVLYVLDGQKHFRHTAASVEFLAAQGEIPEMIVVAITSTVRLRDFTPTDWSEGWSGGGGAPKFKTFLSAELIPTIERTFRTNDFRVLSGASLGGQFALYCLASEPSLFKAYFAFVPNLDWDDNLPQRALQDSFASDRDLRVFLFVARSDDFGVFLDQFEKLLHTLRTDSPRGFRWQSRAFPLETHGTAPLIAQIDALRTLYAGYRFHEDLLVLGFDNARQHFEDASDTVGSTLEIPEHVTNSFGYAALSEGSTEDAIALFKRNVESNPNSANAHDSLADGFAAAEQWKNAAEASSRGLELAKEFKLPDLSYYEGQVRKMVEQLEEESARSK